MTQFGIAESAWVVWTVLNATNDRAPKQRRNTYAEEMRAASCVMHESKHVFVHYFS